MLQLLWTISHLNYELLFSQLTLLFLYSLYCCEQDRDLKLILKYYSV